MDYENMTIQDIIDWCKDNNQVNWLKNIAKKKVDCKVYPRVMIDGKSKADKTKQPHIEKRPITFIQIKKAFCEKFMPEIIPERKSKKPTMYDLIANL